MEESINRTDNQTSDLKTKWLDVIQKTNISDYKYFHLTTVENLIFHLKNIPNTIDRDWIYSTLMLYLNECISIAPNIDRETSNEIFDRHLDKITNYYSKNIGFILITNRILFWTFYMILFLASYFIFNFWVSLIPVFISIFRSFMIYKKWKDKKVYSIFY